MTVPDGDNALPKYIVPRLQEAILLVSAQFRYPDIRSDRLFTDKSKVYHVRSLPSISILAGWNVARDLWSHTYPIKVGILEGHLTVSYSNYCRRRADLLKVIFKGRILVTKLKRFFLQQSRILST